MSVATAGRHALLAFVAIVWLFPLGWVVYTSFRPLADTASRGYVSLPGQLTLDNYVRAVQQGDLLLHLASSAVVVVPAVVLVLMLSTALAFVLTSSRLRFAVPLLIFVTAGSLLPPHVAVAPLVKLFVTLPVPPPISDNGMAYDQLAGVICVHLAFQLGFCTFVLAGFMRTIPRDVIDAARLDGASIWHILRAVIAPLSRPALAALAALESAWIYNDFLWGLVLIQTPAKRPITSALANLSGEFFTDMNVLAAAGVLVAVPTLIAFFVLRRSLTRGLTLGATHG